MRIGIDARELQGRPTGTGRYLRNLLREWAREAGDTLIAYFNGPAPDDPVTRGFGLHIRPLGPGGVRGTYWQERVLPTAAEADRLDVLFSPAYTCPIRLRVPRVTTVHDLSFFSLPQDFTLVDGFRRRYLVSRSVAVSAAIVAVSDFTRREICRRFPEAAERVFAVLSGRDDDLAAAPERSVARQQLDLTGPYLLTVGTLLNRRCLPDLLQAVALVARRHPDLTLEVVGENRTHPRLDLPALVRDAGLERRVLLPGFVSEAALALRYGAADVAIFLSEYEGFGLPALEAMARGVPVVASRPPALGEIFRDAALLVEPRDPPGIAAAIGRILDSAALATDLRARGRVLAARHSWVDAARATRDILERAAR